MLLVGDFYEAENAYLRGRVVFHNKTAMKIPAIRLNYIGDQCICFPNPRTNSGGMVRRSEFHREEVVLHSSTEAGPVLRPGNHEWPFEILIKGVRTETLQGLSDTHISYHLRVVIERGAFAKDLRICKPVRIIRTYNPTSISLNQSVVVDSIWPERVKYTISTPSRAVVFGSMVPCDFVLIPLVKGLKVESIHTILTEKQEYHFPSEIDSSIRRDPYVVEKEVVFEDYEVPDNVETEDIDGLEGYRFRRQIQVPRELGLCRLSIDPGLPHRSNVYSHSFVRVAHYLKTTVIFRRDTGSQLDIYTRLEIALFLTPNQRLDSKNRLINSGAVPMGNNADMIANDLGAPPSYGQHVADETVGIGSNDGPHPPSPVESSQNSTTNLLGSNSDEQISTNSLRNQTTNLLGSNSDEEISANTLRNRLSSLINPVSRRFAVNDSNHLSIVPRVLADINQGSTHRDPRSQVISIENGTVNHHRNPSGSSMAQAFRSGPLTPIHIEYDNIALSRVPSYATASRAVPPSNESLVGLPTYKQVTSRPPSPDHADI